MIGFAHLVTKYGDGWRGPALHRIAELRRAQGIVEDERGPLDGNWKRAWWGGFMDETKQSDDLSAWIMRMSMPPHGRAWRDLIMAVA